MKILKNISTNYVYLIIFSLFLLISSCKPLEELQPEITEKQALSSTDSSITVSANKIKVGKTLTVTITLKDKYNLPLNQNPILSTGKISYGTFGPLTNTGDGIFSCIYTGVTGGPPVNVIAMIDKDMVQSSSTIQVIPNYLPTSKSQKLSIFDNTSLAITLKATDFNNEDTLTYTIFSMPSYGTLSGNPPNVIYTPNIPYSGDDVFSFKAHDGTGYSAAGKIEIKVTHFNHLPIATEQTLAVNDNSTLSIKLAATDANPEDTLTYTIVTPPAHGTLSGTMPNLIYTPNNPYEGLDTFTFKAHDGTVHSAAATVSINVTHINYAPVAQAQSVSASYATPVSITLVATDGNPEDTLTYSIVAGPLTGTLIGSGTDFTYTPSNSYTGSDSFTFKVNDGTVDSATVTVSITVTMPAPGSFDLSFGDGGKVFTQIGNQTGHISELVYDSVELSDGSIISVYEISGSYELRKYSAIGITDQTFGVEGRMSLENFTYAYQTYAQADGKFIVMGYGCPPGGTYCGNEVIAKRFNLDGTVDETYGDNGLVRLSPDNYIQLNMAILMPDNSLYVNTGDGSMFSVLKFTPSGALDSTFGSNGQATFSMVPVDGFNQYFYASHKMAVLNDSSIFLTNGLYDNSWSGMGAYIVRMTSSGAVDTNFNNQGWLFIYNGASTWTSIESIAQGQSYNQALMSIGSELWMMNANGTLDSNWGTNGKVSGINGTNIFPRPNGSYTIASYDYSQFQNVSADGAWLNGVQYSSGVLSYVYSGKTTSGNGLLLSANIETNWSSFLYNQALNYSTYNPNIIKINMDDATWFSSFASGGYLQDKKSLSHDFAKAITTQSDGKILVAGSRDVTTTFDIVRYHANGSLDNTFGVNGIATITVGDYYSLANTINVLDDNSIIVSGRTYSNGVMNVTIIKLLSDGSLDANFGSDGFLRVTAGSNNNATLADGGDEDYRGMGLAIDNSNNIVVGMSSYDYSLNKYLFSVSRYTSLGIIDPSFGTAGRYNFNFTNDYKIVNSLKLQADGKIVLAGMHSYKAFVARILANGSGLDTSFADAQPTKGLFVFDSNFMIGAHAIAFDADNKILIGGRFNYSHKVIRLTSSGLLDASFGTNGSLNGPDYKYGSRIDHIIALSNGKILISGTSGDWLWSNGHEFLLARLNQNGSLDASFGTNGTLLTDLGMNKESRGHALALDSNGNILQAGSSHTGSLNGRDFAVIRIFQ